MREQDIINHQDYKAAKKRYYFDRWKWVIWNAFISIALYYRIKQHYEIMLFVLFLATSLVTLLLMILMPKRKFEDSDECRKIIEKISRR